MHVEDTVGCATGSNRVVAQGCERMLLCVAACVYNLTPYLSEDLVPNGALACNGVWVIIGRHKHQLITHSTLLHTRHSKAPGMHLCQYILLQQNTVTCSHGRSLLVCRESHRVFDCGPTQK